MQRLRHLCLEGVFLSSSRTSFSKFQPSRHPFMTWAWTYFAGSCNFKPFLLFGVRPLYSFPHMVTFKSSHEKKAECKCNRAMLPFVRPLTSTYYTCVKKIKGFSRFLFEVYCAVDGNSNFVANQHVWILFSSKSSIRSGPLRGRQCYAGSPPNCCAWKVDWEWDR